MCDDCALCCRVEELRQAEARLLLQIEQLKREQQDAIAAATMAARSAAAGSALSAEPRAEDLKRCVSRVIMHAMNELYPSVYYADCEFMDM